MTIYCTLHQLHHPLMSALLTWWHFQQNHLHHPLPLASSRWWPLWSSHTALPICPLHRPLLPFPKPNLCRINPVLLWVPVISASLNIHRLGRYLVPQHDPYPYPARKTRTYTIQAQALGTIGLTSDLLLISDDNSLFYFPLLSAIDMLYINDLCY